jgi:hypothetical protein
MEQRPSLTMARRSHYVSRSGAALCGYNLLLLFSLRKMIASQCVTAAGRTQIKPSCQSPDLAVSDL